MRRNLKGRNSLIHGSSGGVGMGRGEKSCPGPLRMQKTEIKYDLRTIHQEESEGVR